MKSTGDESEDRFSAYKFHFVPRVSHLPRIMRDPRNEVDNRHDLYREVAEEEIVLCIDLTPKVIALKFFSTTPGF